MIEDAITELMRSVDIPRYATDEVNAYMDRLALADSTYWCWRRLNSDQNCPSGPDGHSIKGKFYGYTDDKGEPYSHPIPIEMLRRAGKIAAEFPDSGFFVSDYTSEQPDPFIMCWHPGMKNLDRIVFGVWDEPGFE